MVTAENQVEFVLLKRSNDPLFAQYLADALATIRRDNPRITTHTDEQLLSLPISMGGTPLGELIMRRWAARLDEQPHSIC